MSSKSAHRASKLKPFIARSRVGCWVDVSTLLSRGVRRVGVKGCEGEYMRRKIEAEGGIGSERTKETKEQAFL